MTEASLISGSCLCRGVTWEILGPLQLMSHCHCSMCRKFHGAAFGTYVGGSSESFRWTTGEALIRRYESSPGHRRGFCSRCGSGVPGEPESGMVFVPAGNLDEDPDTRPICHIFAASQAVWYEIPDALPRFDDFPPGMDAPVIERPEPSTASNAGATRGSCLCGGVEYEIGSGFDTIVFCHCSRCQKGRSAAHAANLFGPAENFRWIRGEDQIERFRPSDAKRFTNAFCRTCGSILPRGNQGQGRIGIPAGSLDGDPGGRPRIRIFTGSKAPWYEITDELRQFEEAPPPQ